MLAFIKGLLSSTKKSTELPTPEKPRILVFTENLNATYFISFDIPFKVLRSEGALEFEVVTQLRVGKKGTPAWEKFYNGFNPNLVIMTRYGLPHGREILDYFKEKEIPVIYHIDDNLLEIPSSLGAAIQMAHGAAEVIEERRYLLENCDLTYASTSYLAQHLQSVFPSQKIFSGMYAPYMASHITKVEKKRSSSQTIGYMGSKGHQEDLELVVPALIRLMDDNPTLRFEVFGSIKMPDSLIRFGNRVKSHQVNKGYVQFLNTLADLNWDVGLAPLVNEKFNLCKAPTKFIEYTAAGIPVVASDILVYSQVIPEGGGMLVQDDWHAAITDLLNDQTLRESMVETAHLFCAYNFSEKQLQAQLKNLLGRVVR
ncbi:glycosyltransferase [Pseudomonas viridiflava]|uniref:glycosyltransferase n=1 Tax=Pseudomonas viridiflava TaxID=33069 RepID=UPI0013C2E5FE|nr:glycosyltransferase [Pseudomonas viridiflava]